MRTEIYLKAKNGTYDAKAIYEDGKITVLKGSIIRTKFADHVRGGKSAKKYRDDSAYVAPDGKVVKNCVFSSPSTAGQFVMGSSVNGWTAWHVDNKTTLKNYVKSIGNE